MKILVCFYFYLLPDIIDTLIIFSIDSYDEDESLLMREAIQDEWIK